MTDLRQSEPYALFMSRTGWQVIRHQNQNVFIRKLGFLGSIIKIQRHTWPLNLDQIDQLARLHRAFTVKLEPAITIDSFTQLPNYPVTENLKTHGFHPDSWPLIPAKTQTINLQQSLLEIQSDFHANATRNIKIAKKNNLKIEIGDWQTFYTHWQPTARKRGLAIPSKSHFQALVESFNRDILILNCFLPSTNPLHLPLAKGESFSSPPYEGGARGGWTESQKWLGGLIIPIANHRSYYYFATATPLGKQLRAPYLLTLEAIKQSKNLNCRQFDFDGIADPRFKATNNRDWRGFSDFKAKFGGEVVTYIGSFTKYYSFGKLIGFLDKIMNR